MGAISTAALTQDAQQVRRTDWRIITLIGIVHASSHFMQLVLPALYLSLTVAFSLDFVQLGFLASVFFLVSGVGQASSGFVVDRIGPVPVLYFGLGGFALAALLIGVANGYTMLLLGAFVAGAANSVFHPVDYFILNHRVSSARLGHAFSMHGLTGNLGWAIAPVFISSMSLWAGWRVAVLATVVLLLILLVWVWLWRHLLAGLQPTLSQAAQAVSGRASAASTRFSSTLRGLAVQPALWGAFLFFAFSSVAFSAVQLYTIPLFSDLYLVDALLASSALSGYMLASAVGMAAGGFLVGSSATSERIVAVSLVVAGALLALLAVGGVSVAIAAMLLALAGFCSGVAAPSRDMLVRRVTPKGATGSVYGLVYSGTDVGMALGPLLFGVMLDLGFHQGPWLGAGVAFVLAAWLALLVARFALRSQAA